jgi:hypothetical protein
LSKGIVNIDPHGTIISIIFEFKRHNFWGYLPFKFTLVFTNEEEVRMFIKNCRTQTNSQKFDL